MPTHICHVLLFEDHAVDANYFCETLSESENTQFQVEVVVRLEDGLELLAADSERFDICVVDLSLPDSQGIETFERVVFTAPKTPVIVLSGLNDRDMAVSAVQMGAQDYLVKGDFQPYNLEKSLRFAIERRRLQDDVKAKARELQTRLEASLLAKHIQENLFPENLPQLPGFDLAARSFPADETGGDFFDFLLHKFSPAAADNKVGSVGLVIGDVGGHGIGPALIMSAVRSYLRGLQRHTPSLSELLYEVNNHITVDTRQERLISLFVAELDIQARTFSYCGAGHESHVLRADGTIETLDRVTFPLGIDFDVEFPLSTPTQLETGDILVFHTDGIAEARKPGADPYGTDRLLRVVHENRQLPSADIISAVYTDVQLYSGRRSQKDDITLMLLKAL